MIKGNRKLMLAILLGLLSMTLSYASLYSRDIDISRNEWFNIGKFGEITIPIRSSITSVYLKAEAYVNVSNGSGILAMYFITKDGGEYSLLKTDYSKEDKFYVNLTEYADILNDAKEIKLIINAKSPTEGYFRVIMKGLEQPYYFLSIIAIPIILASIVLFFMGMYDAFVAIKESRRRKFWE